jgi:hypothetical protein
MKKQKRVRGVKGIEVVIRGEAGVIATMDDTRCHFRHQRPQVGTVGVVEEPFSTCVQGHTFCRHHMDVVCGIDVVNCPDDVKEAFATGCPVCWHVCPCEACCQDRGEEPGPQLRNPPCLVFAHELQNRPLSDKLVDAVRISAEEFSDELFEKYVIRERVPLVLTHMMEEGRLSPELWDLPTQVRRLQDDACPPKALCQVRIQGISPTDAGAYRVLEELRDRDPREFFMQSAQGGTQGRREVSEVFRDSEHGRCVWYVKDWSFNEFEPRWGKELLRALPERLRPGNSMDLLSGLQGAQGVDVLMAYIGAAGTRTPLHLDKAASIAFNCVTWAENEAACKKWWMFHPEDRVALDNYIRKTVGDDAHLAEDSHWLDPADFNSIPGLKHRVFSFEQRAGDLVIVPPNSAHCVMNQGGLTFAVAANIIDASVAGEALEVESRNQSMNVPSVYKVSGAIWGSMLTFRKRRNTTVPPEILDACRIILANERKGLKRVAHVVWCGEKQLQAARNFLNMVTCDFCKIDVFNAHVVDYAGSKMGRIFCLRKGCLNEASHWIRHPEDWRLIVPRTVEELEAQLNAAME